MTNPTHREGDLHIARQRIISNRSLLRNADRSGLPQFIQSKPLIAKLWAPPNWYISHAPRISNEDKNADLNQTELIDIVQGRKKPGSEIDELSDVLGETANLGSIEAEDTVNSPVTNGMENSLSHKPRPKIVGKKGAKNDESIQWLGDKVSIYLKI